VPFEKKGMASTYILLKVSGAKISKETIKRMRLEKEAGPLDKLIELYNL